MPKALQLVRAAWEYNTEVRNQRICVLNTTTVYSYMCFSQDGFEGKLLGLLWQTPCALGRRDNVFPAEKWWVLLGEPTQGNKPDHA
jgi:hypothetical protein